MIFNDPATIILWADGSKTVVKANGEYITADASVVNHEEHIQQWIRGEKSEIVLDALEKGLRAKLKDVSDQLDLL